MRPPHIGNPKDLYPFIDYMKMKNIQLISFLSLMGVEKKTIPPHHKIENFMTRMGTAKNVTNQFYKLTGKQPKTFEDFVKENINIF